MSTTARTALNLSRTTLSCVIIASCLFLVGCAGSHVSVRSSTTSPQPSATSAPQPGCTRVSGPAGQSQQTVRCMRSDGGTVDAPLLPGLHIDMATVDRTGEVSYLDSNGTPAADFAYDMLYTDAQGASHDGLLLVTVPEARVLEPKTYGQWALIPGISAKSSARIVLAAGNFSHPGFPSNTPAINVLAMDGSKLTLVNNIPDGESLTITRATDGSDLAIDARRDHFVNGICSNHVCPNLPADAFLGTYFYTSPPSNSDTKAATFGTAYVTGVGKATFMYGLYNGGFEVATHLVKISTVSGDDVYIGGFLAES